MIRASKIIVLVLFATLVAAACKGKQATTVGGSSPTTEAQTPTPSGDPKSAAVDVCQWFTRADAEALLKTSVEQKPGNGGYGLGACSYSSDGKVTVEIEAGSVTDYQFLVNRYEDAEKISGVGQDAIWVSSFTTLDVKLNDNYFAAVKVNDGNKDLAIEIGKKVAAAAG